MLDRLCIALFCLRIGDDVLIEEGVYVNHGYSVIDGITRIGKGAIVTAWATVLPETGHLIGPDIEPGVFLGTKSCVVGDVTIGNSAQVGSGAVVVADVPANAVVAGVPARVIAEDVPGLYERAFGLRGKDV